MATVEIEYCVISDLISKPFSRRSFSEKNEIIKIGRPCPIIPNLTSVHKDKKREYIRHFNTSQYDNTIWLTGSSVLNKLYCWPCLLFSTENGVWSKVGFDNLNTLTVAICRHEKSINHLKCFLQINTFGRNRIDHLLDEQKKTCDLMHNEKVKKNRTIFKRMIDAVCFLAKQELPLRGHDETSTSINRGNYLELLELIRQYDPILDNHLKESIVFRGTSSAIQNDIIVSLGTLITNRLKEELDRADFVALILDETSDIINKSQFSTVVRFVDKNGDVQERFLHFTDVSNDRSAVALFEHNFVKRKLPSVAPTRWNFTSRLVNTIKENYDMLILFFEHIHDNSDDWDSDSILKVQGFLFFLKKFLSKFLLNIFSTIFSFTDVLFDILQTKAMDIAYCIKKVKEIIIKLQQVRENDFEKIFNDLNTDGGNSCEPPARKRIRTNQAIGDNLNYRRLFSEILDNILNQIKSRFESMGKFEFFSLLNSELYEKYNKVFPDNELKCLDEQYGRFFDILRLKNELHVLYSSEDFKNKPIFEIIKFMNLNKLDLGLKEVYKLAKLIATIPSTTASAERSFSALKRIKTYCRSTQGQDRLSSLAILSIEKKILDDLKMNPEFYDNVTEIFVEKERRIDFIYK
ncbi:zinc finger MYM-type protein 1-like [Aphis craccivora]|uniref:Zinc finger MYM-type protein 1-like n=1 Tax=Aphis craccivora TaxID=307492 RepID=A0A6G0VZ88_APHCR|nr:zinc finger MYM-type protein 1-like [Aphis craccivora]